MCTILNPLFSLLTLAGIALAMLFIPPAIAVLTSSFYHRSDATTIRLFATVFLLVFLWFGDIPWQLVRVVHYYHYGVVVQATVVMRRSEFGYPVPFYQYTPPFQSAESVIVADASLYPSQTYGQRSASLNWLHHEGMTLSVRIVPTCPTIAWTNVQDVSVVVGLFPIVIMIVIWLLPVQILVRRDDSAVFPPESQEPWRRP